MSHFWRPRPRATHGHAHTTSRRQDGHLYDVAGESAFQDHRSDSSREGREIMNISSAVRPGSGGEECTVKMEGGMKEAAGLSAYSRTTTMNMDSYTDPEYLAPMG